MKTAPLFDLPGHSLENDEWYTPAWLFRALGVECDLDPCSPGAPVETIQSPQAPIAKLTLKEGFLVAELYARGLSPGKYDLYCEPSEYHL